MRRLCLLSGDGSAVDGGLLTIRWAVLGSDGLSQVSDRRT
ncbi:MAG: hypothetical protein QOF88_1639 [Mycobacterium sp.]|jgi:hypothetical protein|nr:hypothetical protein [Mycobacterium sp.]